jgi:hypothetical protein
MNHEANRYGTQNSSSGGLETRFQLPGIDPCTSTSSNLALSLLFGPSTMVCVTSWARFYDGASGHELSLIPGMDVSIRMLAISHFGP